MKAVEDVERLKKVSAAAAAAEIDVNKTSAEKAEKKGEDSRPIQ